MVLKNVTTSFNSFETTEYIRHTSYTILEHLELLPPLCLLKIITYTVTETETIVVYDIKNANMCLGPCRSVYKEGYRIIDGNKKVWGLKPYSGGSYTLHYPDPGEAYGYAGPVSVFKGMRICSRCNARYVELRDHVPHDPDDPEMKEIMAFDCMKILNKLQDNAFCLTPGVICGPVTLNITELPLILLCLGQLFPKNKDIAELIFLQHFVPKSLSWAESGP
jgi:hypothetical protein